MRSLAGAAFLVLAAAAGVVQAQPTGGWEITVGGTGRIDLSNGAVRLSSSCPSVIFPPSTLRVSLCSAGWNSSAAAPIPGRDERYGNYTETMVTYQSQDHSSNSAIQLSLRSFSGRRVLHARLLIKAGLTTNFLSPLDGAAWSLKAGIGDRILNVPFDNNIQSGYASVTVGPLAYGSSAFVTALYNEKSRHGLVVGFLEHDMWKTGVEYRGDKISAVAGLNGHLVTRDLEPHGMVVSATASPLLSIAAHDDWRTGLEEYAGMMADNGGVPAPLPAGVDASPISGWNSWGMTVSSQAEVTVKGIDAASTLLAELRDGPAKLGTQQYLDRDAIYGGLNDTSTIEWGRFVKSNGQGPGTYMAPFVYYGTVDPKNPNSYNVTCESDQKAACDASLGAAGTPPCWHMHDVLLKDSKGQYINDVARKLEGGQQFLKDPTHPWTKCNIQLAHDHALDSVAAGGLGYTLVKEDFLSLASTEGDHWDKAIAPTGMAAYNYALKLLSDAAAGRAVLDYGISLPLPIGVAGHTRHHGCEQMFGGVAYMMNEFAGGWWLNRLYSWLNPDSVGFIGDYWFRPVLRNVTKHLSMDGRSRVAKAVVFGGVFWNSDDLSNATTAALARGLMSNPRVNSMWSMARGGLAANATAFRPVSWGKGVVDPAGVFVRPGNGDVAMFNYSPLSRTIKVDLKAELGLPAEGVSCVDAWGGNTIGIGAESVLSVKVKGLSSELIQCRGPASSTVAIIADANI